MWLTPHPQSSRDGPPGLQGSVHPCGWGLCACWGLSCVPVLGGRRGESPRPPGEPCGPGAVRPSELPRSQGTTAAETSSASSLGSWRPSQAFGLCGGEPCMGGRRSPGCLLSCLLWGPLSAGLLSVLTSDLSPPALPTPRLWGRAVWGRGTLWMPPNTLCPGPLQSTWLLHVAGHSGWW